jgi:hypothetical protein
MSIHSTDSSHMITNRTDADPVETVVEPTRARRRPFLRRPLVRVALAVAVLVVGAGLALTQPWRLWIDHTVNEALPAAGAQSVTAVAHGTLVSHEHRTSGTVRIVRLADGSRMLRLENLDTTNGPLLKVWLSDAQVRTGKSGWHVFDDGRHLSLGRLKGNKGNQNYAIPASADLGQYRSVTIWCDRFNVSFGAAKLVRYTVR